MIQGIIPNQGILDFLGNSDRDLISSNIRRLAMRGRCEFRVVRDGSGLRISSLGFGV